MDAKQTVIAKLDELKINYTLIEHDPVYTIEEMEKIDIENINYIVKNLFLRDAKGRQHYLVVADKDQKIDLKTLQDKIGSTKLSFASEDRLQKYLKLTKGAVSPFGVLNDETAEVEVIFDKNLVGRSCVAVHPNDNSATVVLSYEDLEKIVKANGNTVKAIEL